MPSAAQIGALKAAAEAVPLDGPVQRLTNFFAGHFNLNAVQQADLITVGFDGATLAEWTAHLTRHREELLDSQGAIPSYVIYSDVHRTNQIAGLKTYLTAHRGEARLAQRIEFHDSIRTALHGLTQGHYLEAVGAAILAGLRLRSRATAGSGDQGIDFFGSKPLIELDPAFRTAGMQMPFPGQSTFVLGSSKKAARPSRPLLNPAHVRELVGGWLIQRSREGLWRAQGIQMLSPVQMVLLTTYRLSPDAKQLCNSIGIQVWNLPETVAFVCMTAPDNLFNGQGGAPLFSPTEFNTWWTTFHTSRAPATAA